MAGSNTARLRSLPEAAERLGLSVKCLRGWVWRRSIPYVKVGRAVRISDETIQRIIDRGTMPALEDWKENSPISQGVKQATGRPLSFHCSNTKRATSSELMFMTLSYHLGFAAAEWLARELKIDIGGNQAILDSMKPE